MERRGQPARWVGQAPHRGEGGLDSSSVGPGGSLGPWGRREGTPTGGPPDQRSPGLWESRLQRGGADLEVGRPGSRIPGYPSEPRTLEGLVIFFNSLLSILSCCILNTWGRGRGNVVSSASGCLPLGWEPGTQELLAPCVAVPAASEDDHPSLQIQPWPGERCPPLCSFGPRLGTP